jgi:hypothetical protein
MKKLGILFFAALLVVAFTLPAAAVETTIGGYWRTRALSMNNFTGEDETEAMDTQWVDTRTRLYFTAALNDNLKFVSKFEMDAQWGDEVYGDIGADGKGAFEVKNAYADFNLGSVNAKVGTQGACVARGFLFCDDFSGANVTFKGEGFAVQAIWVKAYEGGTGEDMNDFDADYYVLNPTFSMGDSLTINPFVMWVTSDDISAWGQTFGLDIPAEIEISDTSVYYLGLNLDVSFDGGGAWFTGIYNSGSIDYDDEGDTGSVDISAYLIALGGNMNLGAVDVHGQVFYATGDDSDDDDIDAFAPPKGRSYYWSEIMGYGTFDWDVSANSPADGITNVMAAGIGASIKPMDKLTLGADVWYAKLAEDDANGNDDLGTEVDLSASYQLVEGLNLDVVAAYLFAGDATYDGENDANPYELGAMLSLSF